MSNSPPIHATCVAIDGKGVLITGNSSCGKSALALQLMAYGATLVSDDRVSLLCKGDGIIAEAPDTIRGLIEARGIGILKVQTLASTRVHSVIDMDQTESERFPVERKVTILGIELPLLLRVDGLHFAAGVFQFVRGGRSTR